MNKETLQALEIILKDYIVAHTIPNGYIGRTEVIPQYLNVVRELEKYG